MSEDAHCRRAGEVDLERIADLRWRLQTDDREDYDAEEKQKFINEFVALSLSDSASETIHWLAEEAGEPVAVMSVRIVKKLPKPGKLNGRWGYLTNVYTLPAFRGKGVGARLLEAVKDWALDEELELLVVWPSETSRGFYERAGFIRGPDPIVLNLEKT